MAGSNPMSFWDGYRDEFLQAASYFAAPTGVALVVVLAVFARYDMMFTKVRGDPAHARRWAPAGVRHRAGEICASCASLAQLYVALVTRIHGCGVCRRGRCAQMLAWTLLGLFFLAPLLLLIVWGAWVASTVKPRCAGAVAREGPG